MKLILSEQSLDENSLTEFAVTRAEFLEGIMEIGVQLSTHWCCLLYFHFAFGDEFSNQYYPHWIREIVGFIMNFSSDKIKNDNYNLRKSAVLQVLNEENGLFSYSKIRTKSIDKLEKEFKSSNNNIIKNHRVDENILDKCITLFRRSMSLHVCDWVGKNENSNNMKLNLMSEFENDGVSFDESNFQFESYLHRFKELSNYRLND